MATVIDALLVTLGLDASGMTKGGKDAEGALKKTEDHATRTAKEMEARGKQAAQYFAQIRNQFLAMAAAFTAGKGIKDFVSSITASDASVGRMAKNVGMSVGTLSAWQNMAKNAGGSAEATAGSFLAMSQAIAQLRLTGESDIAAPLRMLGIKSLVDETTGKLMTLDVLYAKIGASLSRMNRPEALNIAGRLHIDPGLFEVLMKGPAALREMLAEQQKLGHEGPADTSAAAAREAAFRKLAQVSENLGRTLLTEVTPALVKISEWLMKVGERLRNNQDAFKSLAISATALAGALSLLAMNGLGSLATALIAIPALALGAGGALGGMATQAGVATATLTSRLTGLIGLLGKALGLFAVANAGLTLADQHDDIGTWIDERSKLASAFDDWMARNLGIGRTYKEQEQASAARRDREQQKPQPAGTAASETAHQPATAPETTPESAKPAPEPHSATGTVKQPAFTTQPPASPAAPTAPVQRSAAAPQANPSPTPAAAPARATQPPASPAARQLPPSVWQPRGIRNNNPGNLKFVGQRGATREDAPKPEFARFQSMAEGIAAMAAQLQRYAAQGLDTVRKIISKWAPAKDGNNTPAYIDAISKKLGVGADTRLNLGNTDTLRKLVEGIASHENGPGRVTIEQINRGLQMRQQSITHQTSSTSNVTSTETKINQVTVNTQATDPRGIVRAFEAAVQRHTLTSQVNSALA